MRSIWKGAISFGLVTIPVKLYTATEEKDVTFHQVHRSDGGRIQYKRVCRVDGEEVPYGDIAKGYELSSGETVVLTDEDFADLPLTDQPRDRRAAVRAARADRPDLLRQELLPRAGQGRDQAVRAAARRARASPARSPWSRWRCATASRSPTLRVRDGVFVLETMLWPDEVRTPDFGFLDEDVEVRPQELAMAGSLIETLTGRLRPAAVHRHLPRGARSRSSRPRSRAARSCSRGVAAAPPAPSSTSWRRCGPASRRPRRAGPRTPRGRRGRRRPQDEAPPAKAPARKKAAAAKAPGEEGAGEAGGRARRRRAGREARAQGGAPPQTA